MSAGTALVSAPESQDLLLADVRVLDFTRVLAGPFATMVLADLGARVIKVELPDGGDESRGFGPFVGGDAGDGGVSAYFLSVNRGKQSVTIDLRTERGRELALELASHCDVLVENFRPGSMARFGLDYATVASRNQQIVYASVSGFGQSGPYSPRPAYDVIVQAMSGLASITGLPGQPPVRVGSSTSDLSAALYCAVGVLAALTRARSTGMGQHVDVSMLDCQISLLENAIARYDVTGEAPQPLGSRHPTITPFQFFAATDGYVVVAAGNDRLFARLCEVLRRPELKEDPRFADNASRTQHHEQLEAELASVFATAAVDDWLRLLEEAGVPCGPVNDVARIVNDPHVLARGLLQRQPFAGGDVAVPGPPLKFSETPSRPVSRAPELGEHTDDVLRSWLELSPDELLHLRQQGVI
jgi:CoA:oxalate CoA-transferase